MDRDSRQSQLKSQPKHIHPSRELRLNIVQCLSQVGKVLVNNTQNTVQEQPWKSYMFCDGYKLTYFNAL